MMRLMRGIIIDLKDNVMANSAVKDHRVRRHCTMRAARGSSAPCCNPVGGEYPVINGVGCQRACEAHQKISLRVFFTERLIFRGSVPGF